MINRIVLLSTLLITIGQIFAQSYYPGFSDRLIVDQINPVSMTIDHHSRIWVIEKDGRVFIIEADGTVKEDAVIDLEVDDFNERGLMGIALHPDLDNYPYLYLYYSVKNENHNRLSRFTLNGDFVIPNSEEILLDFDELSGGVHNGGGITFDAEGFLYLGTGDGARSANSQNLDNLLGKIIRIDAEGNIPTDNPFYDSLDGPLKAIYSLGIRNPFNMTYDESSGNILFTDVGAGAYEEINTLKPGKNYGWPLVEGPASTIPEIDNYQDPSFAYSHDEGCAIVGMSVYNPESSEFPETLRSMILYADYCRSYIKAIDAVTFDTVATFAREIDRPLQTITDHETGQLYLLTRAGIGGGSQQDNTSTEQGALWAIDYLGEGAPQIAVHPASTTIPFGESATISVRANGSQPIHYQWIVDGLPVDVDSSVIIMEMPDINESGYNIRCIVSNSFGSDTSNVAKIKVMNNSRPQCNITVAGGGLFSAGDTISFSGLITDQEDGNLPLSAYQWKVKLHHNVHTHPVMTLDEIDKGSFVVPLNGETDTDIWFRITLSGIDQSGFIGTTYMDIFPEVSEITLAGTSGATINVDGKIRELPYTFPSLKHLKRSVLIPARQMLGDSMILFFNQWQDGPTDLLRTISAGDSRETYTLLFDTLILGDGSGLIGTYYNDPEFDFDEAPLFEVIDSIIDMDWGLGTPFVGNIDVDFFSVRWEGFIQPYSAEAYTFYTISDDGVRLWINDSLIIDDWINHAPKENIGTYTFNSTDLIPITLEYFERAGGASINMSWSSSITPKEIIPSRQLYPIKYADIHGSLWIDENQNFIQEEADPILAGVTVLLFDVNDNTLILQTATNHVGEFLFRRIPPGNYYINIVRNNALEKLLPVFGINEAGFTENFNIGFDQDLFLQFIFDHNQTTSISDGESDFEIEVYPNPTASDLFVKTNNNQKIREALILDLSGKSYFVDMNNQGGERYYIPIDYFSPGIYVLKIWTDKGSLERKIIKL